MSVFHRSISCVGLLLGLLTLALLFSSCSQRRLAASPQIEDRAALCRQEAAGTDYRQRLRTLNKISRLFELGCSQQVIDIASVIMEEYRHKTFRMLRETAEFFIPEGTITDYVLESYEREYLAMLTALSYQRTGRNEEAQVMLNRCYVESAALIYNHGNDPLNTLLQAAMRENLELHRDNSRPLWLAYTLNEQREQEVADFATRQIAAIDQASSPAPKWTVASFGHFPEVSWSMTLKDQKSGYFRIKPSRNYEPACASATGFRLTTKSWFHKIGIRHSKRYHPIVNLKSWIRLPIGAIYSIATAATGAGLIAGGCAADLAYEGDGYLCEISLQGGIFLLEKADDIGKFIIKPDLRHWTELPDSFVATTQRNMRDEPCLPATAEDVHVLLSP